MNNHFKKRFCELEQQSSHIEASKTIKFDKQFDQDSEYVDYDLLVCWKVKVRDLLIKSCGGESQHFQAFEKYESIFERSPASFYGFQTLRAVFIAAKEDFEGGYLLSIIKLTQAEVFNSELEQAKSLLDAGYYVPAAVIAGTVLETSLRQLCDEHHIVHGKLDKMNSDLAKAGVYNVLIQKRVTVWADIRNSAAHGKLDQFKKEDVNDMIRDVNNFLVDHLKT